MKKAWESRAEKGIKKLRKSGESEKARVLSKIFALTKDALDGKKLPRKTLNGIAKMAKAIEKNSEEQE